MKLKALANSQDKRSRKTDPEKTFSKKISGWDVFFQSKFIFEIQKQVGKPVSRSHPYKVAEAITQAE